MPKLPRDRFSDNSLLEGIFDGIVVGIILIIIIFVAYVANADTISCASNANTHYPNFNLYSQAHTFTTPNDGFTRNLTSANFDLTLYLGGTPKNIYAVLYTTNQSGIPVLSIATSSAVSDSTLPAYPTDVTTTFNFSSTPNLNPNTEYAIELYYNDTPQTVINVTSTLYVAENSSGGCSGTDAIVDNRPGGAPWTMSSPNDITPFSFSFSVNTPTSTPDVTYNDATSSLDQSHDDYFHGMILFMFSMIFIIWFFRKK